MGPDLVTKRPVNPLAKGGEGRGDDGEEGEGGKDDDREWGGGRR